MADADAVLAALAGGDALFLVHANADADSVASAFALAEAFGGTVAETNGVAASARRLTAHLGIDVAPIPHPENARVVVAVDTSTRAQLGPVGARLDAADLVIVDHHAYGDLASESSLAFVDAGKASCAEVALTLITRAGKTPSRDAAFALATAIVSDSQRFRYGDLATVEAFLSLATPHGFTVADCVAVLEDEAPGDDLPRRIAALKAAGRLDTVVTGGLLLVTSHVSTHEANAATGLLRIGADLAAVASERGGKGRVSARGSPALVARGVHLGEVMNAVAREHGWTGGGHDGAAGMNGRAPAIPLATAVRAAVVARLKEVNARGS